MEEKIIVWNGPENGSKKKVVGGVLFRFTTQNYSASKEQCEKVFVDLMKRYKVQDKVNEAVQTSTPPNINDEIKQITIAYIERSIGPAAQEVLDKGLLELNQLSETLRKIPGAPQNVKVIGSARDRIKLSWDPPAHNPEAAEMYVVFKRVSDPGEWEEVAKISKTKAISQD